MAERFDGEGKIFKGREFIAEVHYVLHIHSHYTNPETLTSSGKLLVGQTVSLSISPESALSGLFGVDRYTLQLSDGRKQEFFVSSPNGDCKATGGPHD
jgi:hypothetical protein